MAKLSGVKTLDMVNGEITKVEHGGRVYERIGQGFSQAKTGDLFMSEGGSFTKEGGFYHITVGESREHSIRFIDERNSNNGYMRGCTIHTLFRKVSVQVASTIVERVGKLEEKVEALVGGEEALKVGDYVVITGSGNLPSMSTHGFPIGTTVKVTKAATDTVNGDRVCAEYLDGSDYWHVHLSHLRKATEDEVADAEIEIARAQFTEGDKVRLLSGGGKTPLYGYKDGGVYKVSASKYGSKLTISGGESGIGFAEPVQLEKISAEEAVKIERQQAEAAKWAKIGRKPGEFKEGDIVLVTATSNGHPIGTIGELVEAPEHYVGTNLAVFALGHPKSHIGQIELITPVEARFDK